jgi:hypothetical protein
MCSRSFNTTHNVVYNKRLLKNIQITPAAPTLYVRTYAIPPALDAITHPTIKGHKITITKKSIMSNRNESAAEFVATVRKDHLVMMEWYNRCPDQDDDDHPTGTNNSTVSSSLRQLREKYGSVYPESWKQVLNWNGWKDTRKVYLQYIQEQESSSSSSLLLETTAATGTGTEVEQQQQQAASVTTTLTSTTLPNSKPKRKSRWGNATTTESVNTTANDSETTTPTDAMPKRGRWGIASTSMDAATTTTTHHHPPNEELEQLRVQLRGLNYKIENVLEEAARVDALPHGDRERSVSPPPSYVYCGRNIYICVCVCMSKQ